MDVGIRELKAKLSEYVERASKGEPIRVTDRGKAKALLIAPPGQVNLDKGIAEGWITPATQEPPKTRKRFRALRTVAEVLEEDRRE